MKYGFLEKIYSTGDNGCDSVYEVTTSDFEFKHMETLMLNKNQLIDFITENKKEIVTDFTVENEVLRCNPGIETIQKIALTGLNATTKIKEDVSEIFKFIMFGASNNFRILDFDENGEICCEVPFRRIKFARDTMSVYVRAINTEGIYNKKLIYMKDGILRTSNFKFSMPEDVSYNCSGISFVEKIETKEGNVVQIWEHNNLPIFSSDMIISKPMINKAMCLREKLNAEISVLDKYIGMLYTMIGVQQEEKPWLPGGSNQTNYGVYFKSSLKHLRKTDIDNLLEDALKKLPEVATNLQEAFNELKKLGWPDYCSKVGAMIFMATAMSEENTETISILTNYKNDLLDKMFWADLYLYKIRATSFVAKIKIVSFNKANIFGGNEKEYTTVREGFYYEL